MKYSQYIFFLSLVFCAPIAAQPVQHPVLNAYIREGLEQSLNLRQIRTEVAIAENSVRDAAAAFGPRVDVSARYSLAGGGRTFDIPVGTLLNPVYSFLNEYQTSQGQDAVFPTIENETIKFLRPTEQETRIRLSQPLFYPAIRRNRMIEAFKMKAKEAGFQAAQQQFIADVSLAYLDVLQTSEVVSVFENAWTLVEENVRVNERLVANGKLTSDAVYRAQADADEVVQQLEEAKRDARLSASYFNLLLNRPLNEPITRVPLDSLRIMPNDPANSRAGNRAEFLSLDNAMEAANEYDRLIRDQALPTVGVALDYGLQGENYRINRDSDFWMASVVLNVNLFDNHARRIKREKIRLETEHLALRRQALEESVLLERVQALDDLNVAEVRLEAAKSRLRSASASFRLVERKFANGMAPLIEFIDARTSLTNAAINQTLVHADWLKKHVAMERASGIDIDQYRINN